MRRSLLPLLSALLVAVPTLAPAAPPVVMPGPVAEEGTPPPSARACAVEFDGLTPVRSDCVLDCYEESWDGPVLHAENRCDHVVWASHVFQAGDGREYRTPCFELAPGSVVAVPEPTLREARRRMVVVASAPGPGWRADGFSPACGAGRSPAGGAVQWLDERKAARQDLSP